MNPIYNLKGLAWYLGVPAEELHFYATTIGRHYSEFPRKKPNGEVRFINAPGDVLKDIQRRIYRKVLLKVPLPESVHGGVKGRSPRTNAATHLHQPCVVRLDIKKCFPSIRPKLVYRLYTEHLGFSPDVAGVLTKLTTYDRELPQGAPTSTALANLILFFECEDDIIAAATRSRSRNTRFIDDLIFSGKNPTDVIREVVKSLGRIGLSVSHKKLDIMRSSDRQEVTGLTVNRKVKPSVSQAKQSQIRAAIFQLDSNSPDFSRNRQSVIGRIAYLKQTNPGAAKRLNRFLESRVGAKECLLQR